MYCSVENAAVLCKNHCESGTQIWTNPTEEEEEEEEEGEEEEEAKEEEEKEKKKKKKKKKKKELVCCLSWKHKLAGFFEILIFLY